MEALGWVGIKYFQAAGTWPQYYPEERDAGPWAEAGPRNTGCFSFIFWGGCWGPKGRDPSEVPKAVQKGTQGLGHSCFPKGRSASKSGGQGLHLCVLPVWGPKRGLRIWEGFPRNIKLCAADATGLLGSTPERRARLYPTAPGQQVLRLPSKIHLMSGVKPKCCFV